MRYGYSGSFVVVDHEGNPASQRWTSPKGWEVDFYKGRVEFFRPGDEGWRDRFASYFWTGYAQIGDMEVCTIPGPDCHGVVVWSKDWDADGALVGRFIVASAHDEVAAEQVASVMAEINRMEPDVGRWSGFGHPRYAGGPDGDPDDPALWEILSREGKRPGASYVYPVPDEFRSVSWRRPAKAYGYRGTVSRVPGEDDPPTESDMPDWVTVTKRRPEVYTPRAWAHFLARRVDAKLLHRRARALWRRGKRAVHRVARDTKARL